MVHNRMFVRIRELFPGVRNKQQVSQNNDELRKHFMRQKKNGIVNLDISSNYIIITCQHA